MPDEEIEKELGYAYLRAVAAIAGFTINFDVQDFGIDGSFRQVIRLSTGKISCSTLALNFQAKSSFRSTIDYQNQVIKYPMKSDAHNALVGMNSETPSPCLLILFHMPRDKDMWVKISGDVMELRHCCYWELLRGVAVQPNSTRTVPIPLPQAVTPEGLLSLFGRLKRGQL